MKPNTINCIRFLIILFLVAALFALGIDQTKVGLVFFAFFGVLMILFVVIIASEDKKRKEKEEKAKALEKICQDNYNAYMQKYREQYGEPTKIIQLDPDDGDDETRQIMVYESHNLINLCGEDYQMSDIIGYSVNDKSQVLRGDDWVESEYPLIGFVGIQSPDGLMVGMGSGGNHIIHHGEKNELHLYTVNIHLDDLTEPVTSVYVINHEEILYEVIGLLNVIIERNKKGIVFGAPSTAVSNTEEQASAETEPHTLPDSAGPEIIVTENAEINVQKNLDGMFFSIKEIKYNALIECNRKCFQVEMPEEDDECGYLEGYKKAGIECSGFKFRCVSILLNIQNVNGDEMPVSHHYNLIDSKGFNHEGDFLCSENVPDGTSPILTDILKDTQANYVVLFPMPAKENPYTKLRISSYRGYIDFVISDAKNELEERNKRILDARSD